MPPFRQVPAIAPQRQSFSRANQPPIQHPMAIGTHATVPDAKYWAELHELAASIYSALAVEYIQANQVPEPRVLKHLAKHAKSAALVYEQVTFEDVEEETQ